VAGVPTSGNTPPLWLGPTEVLARLSRDGDLLAPALGSGGRVPAP
jgi:hypothetical protein